MEPLHPTVVEVTSPITISSTVHDVIYNVIRPIEGPAIRLTETASLQRVVVNVDFHAAEGIDGPGAVRDVAVYGATVAGFYGVAHFGGTEYSSHNGIGYYLTGRGVTEACTALIESNDDINFGVFGEDLSHSTLAGAVVANQEGLSSGGAGGTSTGIEFWGNVFANRFNVLISDANPGYGFAIYGSSARNAIAEFYGDGRGTPYGSDPGISIGGGAHDNTIMKATVLHYTIGIIIGESGAAAYANAVNHVDIEGCAGGGVVLKNGSYRNLLGRVGGVSLVNDGSVDTEISQAGIEIANRTGDPASSAPYANQVVGVRQSATSTGPKSVPRFGVFLGAGTTANAVSGSVRSWSIAPWVDDGRDNSLVLKT